MNNRTVVKLIYEISKKLVETVIQVLSIILFVKVKYMKNLKKNIDQKDELLILGNGPSLNNEIEFIQKSDLLSKDILCVNSFANSQYYNIIKPRYYLLVDPIFFIDFTTDKRLNEVMEELLNNLISKTNWHLTLFIPRYYFNSKFVDLIGNNTNITVVCLNNIPLTGGFDSVKYILFNYSMGNPVWQNVLIAAIFIGIKKKYKKILLIGMDHSWVKYLTVTENNDVILNDKHLNDKGNNNIKLTDQEGSPKRLHTFLFQVAIMFKEYHTLNDYAKINNVLILNYTKKSFIDAFPKELL